jgi:hypothetical protein
MPLVPPYILYNRNHSMILWAWDKLLFNRGNLTSLDNKLMKIRYKTIMQRGEKLLNKIKSARVSSINRAKSIPNNATIRKEYVKCGKPYCQERHGPYYYAYWKDANDIRKLKKKYIGKYLRRNDNKDKNSVKTVKTASTNYRSDDASEIMKNCLKANREDDNSNNIADTKSQKRRKRNLLIKFSL